MFLEECTGDCQSHRSFSTGIERLKRKVRTSSPRVSDKTASCTALLLYMFSDCFERHGITTNKKAN